MTKLERVQQLTAMISDPRQWVQNEWTKRIASELRCILDSPDEPSESYQMQLKRIPYVEIARFLAEDDAARGTVLGCLEAQPSVKSSEKCLIAGCGKPVVIAKDGAVGALCEQHNGNVGLREDGAGESSAPQVEIPLCETCTARIRAAQSALKSRTPEPRKNPADFPGGPMEYPEDFDDTTY